MPEQSISMSALPVIQDKYRLGMFAFVGSEAVFFIILILAFVFYRQSPSNAGGPTPFNSLDVGKMAIFSVCLYASSITLIFAERSHRRGRARAWGLGLFLTIVLGVVFLYGELSEYYTLVNTDRTAPNSDVFASTFYTLTGFHGIHVVVGLLLLTLLFGLTLGGKFSRGSHAPAVRAIAIYWHFVDVVWIVLFPTVYLWSLAGPK